MSSQDTIRNLEKEIMSLRKQLADGNSSAEVDTLKAAFAACEKSCDELKAKVGFFIIKNTLLTREVEVFKHSIRIVNYTVDKILPDDD
jgi:cell division septum initiation protein DivIVA